MSIANGTLYVVATPIGNLDDITTRAQQVLRDVDYIACEDTRHSACLLKHFAITTKTLACHEHNERQVTGKIIDLLRNGQSVALVSDAGTPLISDPGYRLLRQAHEAGIKVSPVPGASALIAALSVAGLATDRFVFEGFLPAKPAARRDRIKQLATEPRTQVFYESSHRIVASLADLCEGFGGERQATLAREISKKFETIRLMDLAHLQQFVRDDAQQQKGEFVLIVAGAEPVQDNAESERILGLLLEELPLKQAAALASKITGENKNRLYQKALQMRHE